MEKLGIRARGPNNWAFSCTVAKQIPHTQHKVEELENQTKKIKIKNKRKKKLKKKQSNEGVGVVQDIQSRKLRRLAVNPPTPAVAEVPRPRTPTPVAGATRPPVSISTVRTAHLVPCRILRRRDDSNSCYQTLHSEDA